MNDCILLKPDLSFEEEIESFRLEMLLAGSSMDGTGRLRHKRHAADWLAFNECFENEETVPDYFVRSDQFIYARPTDQTIVGMIQLRYELNTALRHYGGHIGYSIRPSERQKGYAKKMLAACLEVCRESGLEDVLITCKTDNEASRRTILANGGEYENTIYHTQKELEIERYWIQL